MGSDWSNKSKRRYRIGGTSSCRTRTWRSWWGWYPQLQRCWVDLGSMGKLRLSLSACWTMRLTSSMLSSWNKRRTSSYDIRYSFFFFFFNLNFNFEVMNIRTLRFMVLVFTSNFLSIIDLVSSGILIVLIKPHLLQATWPRFYQYIYIFFHLLRWNSIKNFIIKKFVWNSS